jgi:hypothetical protein
VGEPLFKAQVLGEARIGARTLRGVTGVVEMQRLQATSRKIRTSFRESGQNSRCRLCCMRRSGEDGLSKGCLVPE